VTDNRYSVFKYGTSHKYGASTVEDSLAWGIEVDWDGDNVFDGANESSYLTIAPRISRGRRVMLRPSGQGFEVVQTGTATITLSNHDGRFDAWNTSSPLYPDVEAGKIVRVSVKDKSTNTKYIRFTGIIQDINPIGYGADAKVILRCEDGLRVLRDTSVTAQRTYTDGTLSPTSVDDNINVLLDVMQWPVEWGRDIGTSSDFIRYWYSSGDRNVAAELEDLALSFFGYVFINNLGQLAFIPRFGNTSSVASISQSEMLKDIGNPQPWIIRRNVVKLKFHVRKSLTDAIVWQPLETDPPLASGETRSVLVDYNYNGYPVYLESIDNSYTFSLSPYVPYLSFSVSADGIAPYLTITDYGVRAFIEINNVSLDTLYLFPGPVEYPDTVPPATYGTWIKGDITWTERTDTISNPRNPADAVNQRQLVLDSLWYQDRNQAYDLVDQYQPFISAGQKTPIIQLENRFSKQFAPDLFDVITADIPALGISTEEFRVGFIEDEPVGSNTQAVRTTLYLEPFITPDADAGLWDSGIWDTSVYGW